MKWSEWFKQFKKKKKKISWNEKNLSKIINLKIFKAVNILLIYNKEMLMVFPIPIKF